jgi:hypothetical protein
MGTQIEVSRRRADEVSVECPAYSDATVAAALTVMLNTESNSFDLGDSALKQLSRRKME